MKTRLLEFEYWGWIADDLIISLGLIMANNYVINARKSVLHIQFVESFFKDMARVNQMVLGNRFIVNKNW